MRSLTTEEITACARGYRQTREEEDGLHLLRFGDATMAYYGTSKGGTIRSWCPAGVVLEFFSDAGTIEIRGNLREGARKVAWVDLFVDRRFIGTLGSNKAEDRIEGAIETYCAAGKPRRMQLHLPHTRPFGLESIVLPDDASFEPAPADASPVILFMGDSITQGMDSAHPALTYPMTATRDLGRQLLNCAIGGMVFDNECLPETPIEHPESIVVAYGVNDWGQGRDVEEANGFLGRLRELYPHVPVIVLEPIWNQREDSQDLSRNASDLSLRDYRRLLANIVERFEDIECLGRARLLPPGNELLIDGCHPTTMGHQVYGRNLAHALRTIG